MESVLFKIIQAPFLENLCKTPHRRIPWILGCHIAHKRQIVAFGQLDGLTEREEPQSVLRMESEGSIKKQKEVANSGCIQMQSLEDLGPFGTQFWGFLFLRYNSQHLATTKPTNPKCTTCFPELLQSKIQRREGHPHTVHLGCITCRCRQRILKNQRPAEGQGRTWKEHGLGVQISVWPNRLIYFLHNLFMVSYSMSDVDCLILLNGLVGNL